MQQQNLFMDYQQNKPSPILGHQASNTASTTTTSQSSYNSNICIPTQQQPTNHTYNVNNMNNIQVINQMAPGNQYPSTPTNYIPSAPQTPNHQMYANQYPIYNQMDSQPPNHMTRMHSMPLRPAQPIDKTTFTRQDSNTIDKLDTQVPSGEASVFMGNISFGYPEDEIMRMQQTVGSVRDMKMMQKEDNQSKGFGFCTYNDKDVAISARRNLDKTLINGREIKVDFADDMTNNTNLKKEDVFDRDNGDIINKMGGTAHGRLGAPLKPQNSSINEMMQNFNYEQKQSLIFGIQDAAKYLQQTGQYQYHEAMVDGLAQNESLLDHLENFYNEVAQKNPKECLEQTQFANNQAMWNIHNVHPNNMVMHGSPPPQAMNCPY